jgi:hypothetical protein
MTMETTVQESTIQQEKAINEEYKTWKKNSPFLYEYLTKPSSK